jgi:type II secretory pathway pseudopilin PulG
METGKFKRKNIVVAIIIIALAGAGVVWYLFTEKFGDTNREEANFTVTATALINEFKKNDTAANKKYAEKIITVTGIVTSIEPADTALNLKMADSTGSYVIFAFQQQHIAEAKTIRQGDRISVKGSCSGGAYSEILETEFITFKRCALNQ